MEHILSDFWHTVWKTTFYSDMQMIILLHIRFLSPNYFFSSLYMLFYYSRIFWLLILQMRSLMPGCFNWYFRQLEIIPLYIIILTVVNCDKICLCRCPYGMLILIPSDIPRSGMAGSYGSYIFNFLRSFFLYWLY